MGSYQTDIVPEESPSEVEPQSRGPSGLLRFLLDILETVVLSVLLFAGINALSARIRVDGPSMQPTLHTGEFVIVNKLAYKFSRPELGDVVVFHYPRDPEQEYIKRVIGVAGDHLRISGGQVYVNEKPIEEPYIAAPPAYEKEVVVPENSIFVLGDNRNNSSDSHNWGAVPMEYVVGKALFVYWPPDSWGQLSATGAASASP